MPRNPEIPRDAVHRYSEECAELGTSFQPIARRLLEEQPRLLRFFNQNLPHMENQPGEVSLYLLAVVLRIFQRAGGRLPRLGKEDVDRAAARVMAAARGFLPGDKGFPDRVRAVADRAQPHILDEALWALFEREERKDNEVDVPPQQAALIFLLLWAAVEALDAGWRAPAAPEWDSPPAPQ